MMQKSLQAHARVYALLLSGLFQAQNIGGTLSTAHRGPRYLSLGVRLNDPRQIDKALKLAEPLALAAKTDNVIATRAGGVIAYQIELQSSFWQWYTRADVTGLGIGLGESRTQINLNLDNDPHTLIAGATGSGKTVCLQAALLALTSTATPDTLKLVMVDTNGELSDFTNSAHLALPIAADPREVENALQFVYNELAHRKSENIKDAHRLVLVVDEVSDLPDVEPLKQIAKQGRKYHVHLIIGNQRPKQKDLPDILDNLTGRYIGRVDNAQTSVMLTGHSGVHAHKLTGKGDFVTVQPGGNVARFQVVQPTQADFNAIERAEIAPVLVQPAPVVDLPGPATGSGGRPELTLEYETLGRYFAYKALKQHLSIAGAETRFSHKRTLHTRYNAALREFTAGFNSELQLLRGAR